MKIILVWLAAMVAMAAPVRAESTHAARARDPREIPGLIKQLGDQEYFVRQRAEEKLGDFGAAAFDALDDASGDDDPEIATRARYLLQQIPIEWGEASDPAPVKELLADYDSQDANTRQERMHSLASLPAHSGVSALCRLVCRERSPRLSKQAAAELLGTVKPEVKPDKDVVDLLRRGLAGSRRPAAGWLLTYARLGDDPAAGRAWNDLVAEEVSLGQRAPTQTTPELIAALLKFQFTRLLAQRAWTQLNEAALQFGPQIAPHASLLYTVAEAQLAQGNKARAEEIAEQAFRAGPDAQSDANDSDPLSTRLQIAYTLQGRGLISWCVRECRYIIAHGDPSDGRVQVTQVHLAELYNDQEDYLAAAEVMQAMVKAMGDNQPPGTRIGAAWGDEMRTLASTRGRINYFFARHWESKGDRSKQIQFLEDSLRDDPRGIETLISCYRLADQTPEFHQRIVALVRATSYLLQNQMAGRRQYGGRVDPYLGNQFAWLVANTEGNLDEALRLARQVVDAYPDNGGFCDTLARVYFARGDFESAVKWQTKAVELDPHSGLISRQLALFRKTLEEKRKK